MFNLEVVFYAQKNLIISSLCLYLSFIRLLKICPNIDAAGSVDIKAKKPNMANLRASLDNSCYIPLYRRSYRRSKEKLLSPILRF
jgi:hypothetical protein